MDFKKQTDEELMQAIHQGKRGALEVLYDRYANRLFNFLNKWLHDTHKANDFLQDVFMKVIEAPEKFDQGKKFSTWVYTLAANQCKNEIRNIHNRNRILEANKHLSVKETVIAIEHLDYDNFSRDLQLFINELDEDLRTIFLLRFQEELTVPEISKIMSCPEGTIKSRIFYLMKKMAVKLKIYNPAK